MARRRSSSSKKSLGTPKLLLGLGGLVVVLAVVAFSGVLKPSADAESADCKNFRIASYRQDGSRFASVGNRYKIEGKVENIETQGSTRLISVSMRNNKNERLPLLVPASVKGDVNLTRGDSFVFDVECRTGKSEDGEQVKGILVVNTLLCILEPSCRYLLPWLFCLE